MKQIELADEGPNRDLAVATIEIDNRYAPIPENTRAQLREKTLLGETYVELTQGDSEGPKVPEGGSLPPAQVTPSVQLDEIFRTFDARTRLAFQTWMEQAAVATAGRGADLSAAIANLEPFAADANRVLRVLDTQENAVKALVNNTGRGLRGAERAPGAAPGPDPERRHRLRHHRPPQPGPARDLRGAADLPRRVPPHPQPPRQLRRQRRSPDHPAAPGGARAQQGPAPGRPGDSGLPRLLRRPPQGREALADRAARPAQVARRRPAPAARPGPALHSAARPPGRDPRPLPARGHRRARQRRRRRQRGRFFCGRPAARSPIISAPRPPCIPRRSPPSPTSG